MAKLNFKENAEAIYDKSISATPLPFRGVVRSGLTKLLADKYGETGAINEKGIVEMIKKNTPSLFLEKGMKAIAPLVKDQKLVEL